MESNSTSGYALLGRLFWMFIGPAILFLLAIGMVRDGGGWFTAKDIAFLVVLGGLILGRLVEFREGDPRTATGEPATQSHFRRYSAGVLVIGLGAWMVVNLVRNLRS